MAAVCHCDLTVLRTPFCLIHDMSGEGRLTLILSMQSVVLDARMHESLAKAATAAGGSTATRALASSAHFLCSGSDTVHHRIFFAIVQGAVHTSSSGHHKHFVDFTHICVLVRCRYLILFFCALINKNLKPTLHFCKL